MSRTTHDLYARIPEDLFQQVKGLAERHKRSVTAEVEWALQQYVHAHRHELSAVAGAEPPPASKPRGRKKTTT